MDHNISLTLIFYANNLHLLDQTVPDLKNFWLKTNRYILAGLFFGNRVNKLLGFGFKRSFCLHQILWIPLTRVYWQFGHLDRRLQLGIRHVFLLLCTFRIVKHVEILGEDVLWTFQQLFEVDISYGLQVSRPVVGNLSQVVHMSELVKFNAFKRPALRA